MFDEGKPLRVGYRQGEDGNGSRTLLPQRDRTNTQATQYHYCCNVILGRLRDGRMATPHIHTLTALPLQTIQGNREEQGLSLPFYPRNCPAPAPTQLATDPFLSQGLRHTPLCQCLAQSVVGGRRERG